MLQSREVVELLLRPDSFHTWLEDKNPDVLVGMSGSPTSCPIACFLMESGVHAEVGLDHIAIRNSQNNKILEYTLHKGDIGDWIEHFVYAIDDIDTPDDIDVTASTALEVLNNIIMD